MSACRGGRRSGCSPVVQGYGMTETSLACPHPGRPRLRCGGGGRAPLPNMESKIVDAVTGAELGAGERGEILVRGPQRHARLLERSRGDPLTIDADGWLHTGDVGATPTSRATSSSSIALKELIKYKGMQVAPAELEGVLLTHPAVADVAVIGIPDAEAGEVPKAFVVLKDPVTSEALMHYVASQVAPHKRIRQVEVVEAIPTSASGKILRRVLVERARATRVIPS